MIILAVIVLTSLITSGLTAIGIIRYYVVRARNDVNSLHFRQGWDAAATWMLEMSEAEYMVLRKTVHKRLIMEVNFTDIVLDENFIPIFWNEEKVVRRWIRSTPFAGNLSVYVARNGQVLKIWEYYEKKYLENLTVHF